jgi:eukaryotic-like serine/threonine-protein kinase
VSDATFSPDGRSFVLAGEDGTARLWDVASRKLLLPPFPHGRWTWTVAFSPDGKTVVTGGYDEAARLWDAATGRPIGPPLRHRGKVRSVAVSHDNKSVLTGCIDGRARLFPNAPEVPDDLDLVANRVEVLTGMAFDARQGSIQLLDNAAWLASRERLKFAGGSLAPVKTSREAYAGRSSGLASPLSEAREQFPKMKMN